MKRHELDIRRPPAFMEYGSDLLSLETVKLMSLAERGLLASMRWYVWANDSLPSDLQKMARLLGFDAEEVRATLTDAVLSFFAAAPGAPDRLICPELTAQMKRLMQRRERMFEGTLKSHKSRREHKKNGVGTQAPPDVGTHGESPLASELQRAELKRTALSKEGDVKHPAHKGNGSTDPFLAELEAAEALEKVQTGVSP